MSKIDQIQPGQIPGAPAAPKVQGPQDDQAFRQALEKAAQGLEPGQPAAGPPAKSPAFDPLAAINGVKPPLTTRELSPLHTEGVMRAERTLELLDRYEQMLADERKPLKEVARVVRELDGEVDNLNQVLGRMDPEDGLFGLLQDVAVTAMVQSIKFNRGDYLPAGSRS